MKSKILWLSLISLSFSFGEFPIATSPYRDEDPKIACLGNDLIVAYKTFGDGWNQVKVVRVNGLTGKKIWEKPVRDDSGQSEQQIVVDQKGKIWVVFKKYQPEPWAIVLQRFTPDGVREFGPLGLEISSAEGHRYSPHLCLSSEGGVWVCWQDYRSGYPDIYVTYVFSTGELVGTERIFAEDAIGPHSPPAIVGVENNAVIVWEDYNYPTSGKGTIRAQKINRFCHPQWDPTEGIIVHEGYFPVLNVDGQITLSPVVSDGENIFVAFTDFSHFSDSAIIQKMDGSTGEFKWGKDGVRFHIGGYLKGFALTTSHPGEAVACWGKENDYFSPDIYAQSIGPDPAIRWNPEGIKIWDNPDFDPYDYVFMNIVNDGFGGVVLVWDTYSDSAEGNIMASRVDSLGNVLWTKVICDAPNNQIMPQIVKVDSLFWIIWQDERYGNWDIFGECIDLNGNVGIREEIASVLSQEFQIYPNPFRKFSVMSYQLPVEGYVQIKVYNTSGQVVRRLVKGYQSVGKHRVLWDGRDEHGRGLPSGVYFCELKERDKKVVKKLVLIR